MKERERCYSFILSRTPHEISINKEYYAFYISLYSHTNNKFIKIIGLCPSIGGIKADDDDEMKDLRSSESYEKYCRCELVAQRLLQSISDVCDNP
jgi:hypothetical protein